MTLTVTSWPMRPHSYITDNILDMALSSANSDLADLSTFEYVCASVSYAIYVECFCISPINQCYLSFYLSVFYHRIYLSTY